MKKIAALLVLFCAFLFATSLRAQTRDRSFQAALGVGAAWNPPVRFDLDLNGEYFLDDTFSAGVDFDIFVRGVTSYDLLAFGRYNFQLLRYRKFSPYVGLGVGALFNSNGQGWFDLMAPELGFLWELTPHLYLGPNVGFHTLIGSNTTWDFQTVGQLAWRF